MEQNLESKCIDHKEDALFCDKCVDTEKQKSYENGVLKGAEAVILKFEEKYPTMRIIAQIRKQFQIPKKKEYLWSK